MAARPSRLPRAWACIDSVSPSACGAFTTSCSGTSTISQQGLTRAGHFLHDSGNLVSVRQKLALPGGFLEEHEPWNIGAVREAREETGVEIDPDLEQLVWRSSQPRPNRLLLFSVARPVDIAAFPAFEADAETQERGVIFGPDGLDDEFAFDLHVEAARMFFARTRTTGPHAFARR